MLLCLLLLDTGYTFYQHLTKSLDGDLVAIVLPSDHYQTVMTDPFGWKVLTEDAVYAAPNRFFVHGYISTLFKKVPFLLQKITSPIDSIYYTAAISKTFIHLFLITLLAFLISGATRLRDRKLLLAAVILTPFFQTGGHFYKYIGLVDQSITYSSFYALSMALLILFLKPYFDLLLDRKVRLSLSYKALLVALVFILPFSGPLIPGVVVVIALLCTIVIARDSFIARPSILQKRIPLFLVYSFVGLVFLSVYSLYIGQNNLESLGAETIPLLERYYKIPMGLYYLFSQKLCYPLLFLMIGITLFIHKKENPSSKHLFKVLKWISLFALLYVLLLPLGGYRPYRPDIIRKDTFLPVALALVYFNVYASYLLLTQEQFNYRRLYGALVIVFLAIFTYADESDTSIYFCQKNMLETLSRSKDDIIKLPTDCTLLHWDIISNPQRSKEQSEAFKYWKITAEQKLFYQE